MANVTVAANGQTLTVNDGNAITDVYMSKVTVFSQGDNVVIQWDNVDKVDHPYTNFSSPSGASAQAVQQAIAALLIPVP